MNLDVEGTGFGGEIGGANSPFIPVTNNTFDTANLPITLNQGTFDVSGSVWVIIPIPVNTSIDLVANPVPFTGGVGSTATISMTHIDSTPLIHRYDVEVSILVDVDDLIPVPVSEDVSIDVTLQLDGEIKLSGVVSVYTFPQMAMVDTAPSGVMLELSADEEVSVML